jgi:RNA polymerase sigma factor (sigma-70 family)
MISMHNPDDNLVEKAVHHDRESFAFLYEKHVERVYRHVYYRVSNHADAEDITQEVFSRAWKAIGKYRSTGAPFAAWLITIASNLITDHYKSHQKMPVTEENYREVPGSQISDPAGLAETSFSNALIKKAVEKLKGDKQKVIMMHFIDGFSYEEIARTLKKSEGTIRVIQYRALKDLRRMMTKDQL